MWRTTQNLSRTRTRTCWGAEATVRGSAYSPAAVKGDCHRTEMVFHCWHPTGMLSEARFCRNRCCCSSNCSVGREERVVYVAFWSQYYWSGGSKWACKGHWKLVKQVCLSVENKSKQPQPRTRQRAEKLRKTEVSRAAMTPSFRHPNTSMHPGSALTTEMASVPQTWILFSKYSWG